MRRAGLIAGAAAIALAAAGGGMISVLANAQEAPKSLLPPGFDDPAPAPTPTPRPAPRPAPPQTGTPGGSSAPATAPPSSPGGLSAPVPGNIPGNASPAAAPPPIPQADLSGLPSLRELENLSTDQLDELLGLKPKFDIPPAARRSLTQVGLLSAEEGGLPVGALAKQPRALVRAILAGTDGPLVSRWGHIMLRRALASRLTAPDGMNPVEFTDLRARVLNSMGEYSATRALVQDVDTENWSKSMTSAALTAYIASSDLVGACPAVRLQGGTREDPKWVMLQAICNAYAGEGALAASQLNGAQSREIAPEIDVLLAQRIAGAAGRGRGGTAVSWDGVDKLTPWRFSIANAVGEDIPEALVTAALDGPRGDYYTLAAASAPVVPLAARAKYAELAASRGVLSASAMIDIYSQVYAEDSITGESADRAARLREAYVGGDDAVRITAMRGLWGKGDAGFAGQVMTAFAAARIRPSEQHADVAGELIASMLTAGLDRDAAAWSAVVEPGSMGWALIALSDPDAGEADSGAVDDFYSDDQSKDARKSAFLAAGLAGLGRMPVGDASDYGADLSRQSRWTKMIARAAEVENSAMVALLAGLGMQGDDWSQMTPLHLYHIVSALHRVGMTAQARMIAAEAVARG